MPLDPADCTCFLTNKKADIALLVLCMRNTITVDSDSQSLRISKFGVLSGSCSVDI